MRQERHFSASDEARRYVARTISRDEVQQVAFFTWSAATAFALIILLSFPS